MEIAVFSRFDVSKIIVSAHLLTLPAKHSPKFFQLENLVCHDGDNCLVAPKHVRIDRDRNLAKTIVVIAPMNAPVCILGDSRDSGRLHRSSGGQILQRALQLPAFCFEEIDILRDSNVNGNYPPNFIDRATPPPEVYCPRRLGALARNLVAAC